MKVGPWLWMLVAAVVLIVASSGAQTSADLPPGADGNNWIPISDSAGILLTNEAGTPDSIRLQLPGFNVQTVVPRRGTGILMVKYGGAWMRVDLKLPEARVQPLQH
ncbi:MAG TPA: hypothetical protein VGL98_05515 [Gammaproteobacteria bacterium]